MSSILSKDYYLKAFADMSDIRLPIFLNTPIYGQKIVEYVYAVKKEYYTLEELVKVNFPESPILTMDIKNPEPDASIISQSTDDLNQTQYCLNYISTAMGENALLELFILFKDENDKEFILDMSVFALAYEHHILYHPETNTKVDKPLSKMYMVYVKKNKD